MLDSWRFLNQNEELVNLIEEAALSTILKHFPEIQIFHRACTVRNDRLLGERLLSISKGIQVSAGSNGSSRSSTVDWDDE